MGSLRFDITGDNSNVLKAFRGVQDCVRQTAQIVEQQGQDIENAFNRIKSVASVAFAGFTAKEIVSTLANVRGDFQQFEIAFETMLHSEEKAKAMIADLANLAATTPFDMKGVVAGAKQLLAYGFAANQITDTMRRLGDVSAGLGLNLQDLTWLYGTTMVQGRLFTRDLMQFTGRGIPMTEALAKQFGVTKDKVSELVTAGKVGFPEVEKAIKSMTDEGGQFGGLMEKQSHSITGQISNIEDTIEMAINDLGTQTEGIMNTALDITSTVIDHWKEIGEAVLAAASAIGLYKAMAVGVAAFDSATANVGYAAELSALDALLPKKEEAKKSDLEEAVAKRQLSAAQAELVASKREEVTAYVEELQAQARAKSEAAQAAADKVKALENELAMQDNEVQSLQDAYDALQSYTDGQEVETAEINLNTAANERNNIAKQLQAARETAATAATEANTAANTANTAAQGMNTAATARDTAAKGIHAQFTLLCKKAQDAWNASMFSSPLFWIAATIAAVTYAVYKLATAESAHEAAIRKANEAWDDFDNKVKERQQNIESLIRIIQSETSTEYQKVEAYQQLASIAPQLTDKYDQAALATLDFSKAQKEVAENLDESKYEKAISDVKAYKKQVENLQKQLANDATYNGGRQGGILNSQLGQAQEDLNQAEDKLTRIIELRNEAAENAKPIEIRLDEAKENEEVRQKIFDFYDEAMVLANDWQAANETINFVTGESRLDEFIAKAQKDIADLREDIKKNPADVNLRLQESEKTKVLNNLLSMKSEWKTTGATTIPLIFRADWNTANQALNQAKQKTSALANSGSTESYAKAYTDAQKAYNAAKRKVAEMENNKAKYTATQYEKATQDLKAAKDSFSKLGGDVSGKTAKAADKARKDRVKEENKTAKAQEDLNNRLKSLQQKNIDETISLMRDGTEKKLKEIDNDYAKRIAEISKQEAEFKKKNKEAGKSPTLTKEQTKALGDARYLANLDKVQKTAEISKEQLEQERNDLYEYLKEYGGYQQKKLAIQQEYSEKIAKAQTQGERMSLQAALDKSLSDLSTSELKASIDWESVFNDLDSVSLEYLQKLKKQLQDMLSAKDITAENAQILAEQINKIDTQITSKKSEWKSAFGLVIPELEKMRQLEKEAADAQDEVVRATKDYNDSLKEVEQTQQSILDILSKNGIQANTSDITSQNSQGYIDKLSSAGKDTNELADLFSKLGEKERGLTKNTQTLNTATTKAGQAAAKAGGSFASTVAIIDEVIQKVNQNVQSAVGLVDELGIADTKFGQGVSSFAQSSQYATEAWNSLKNGDFVGTAKGVLGSLRTLGDALGDFGLSGFGSSDTSLAKDVERLTASNENLQKSIDVLSDKMDKATSMSEITQTYEQQKKYLEQSIKNTQEMMIREGKVYSNGFIGIGGKKSSNYKIDKAVSSAEWDRVSSIVGRSVRSASDFWNLTSEEMANVAAYAGDIYDKIKQYADNGKGDVAQYMDTYINYYKQLEELENTQREKLTDISFDNVKSEFSNLLSDMNSDTEDFTNNFEEMMRNAIVNSLMVSKYNKMLEDWYKAFSKAMEDGTITETEKNNLKSQYDSIVADAKSERDALMKTLELDTISKSQSATSGGWTSIGQESVDELNGRFTALQIVGENIADNMVTNVAQMESLVTLGISTNGAVIDIRNMMVSTNSYLEDVVKYTKLTFTEFGNKMDDMYKCLKRI